jgi:hypothetical protein
VLDGDITKDNLGLDEQTVAALQKRISIFIHAASSLSLRGGLAEMAPIVVYPSLAAAKLALSFEHLERFVFVSSAYANSFLHWDSAWLGDAHRRECIVEERIHPLREFEQSAVVELDNIIDFGTTPEHDPLYVEHPMINYFSSWPNFFRITPPIRHRPISVISKQSQSEVEKIEEEGQKGGNWYRHTYRQTD